MKESRWIVEKILVTILSILPMYYIAACKSSHAKSFIDKDSIETAIANPVRDTAFTYDSTNNDPSINNHGNTNTYDSTKKYVYFTFDDGPQPGTMNCFHVVQDLDAKASFFMVGAQIDTKNLKKRVDSIRNGYPQILLCNHSYTHANFNHYKSYYNNADSALRDVIKAQSSMRVPLKIFRTPANNSWDINGRSRCPALTKQLCYLLSNAGYEVAGWDLEWNFDKNAIPVQSANHMIAEIENALDNHKSFVRNNVVILSHDRMFEKPQYADSLRKVIAALKKNNEIVFETMDHYPGIKSK